MKCSFCEEEAKYVGNMIIIGGLFWFCARHLVAAMQGLSGWGKLEDFDEHRECQFS